MGTKRNLRVEEALSSMSMPYHTVKSMELEELLYRSTGDRNGPYIIIRENATLTDVTLLTERH